MRVEATLPDARGQQLDDVAEELGLTRSQLIDEAVSVFLASLLEARRGLRLAFVDTAAQRIVREIITPSLAQLDWTAHREQLTLSENEARALAKALDDDSEAPPGLRKLLRRRK
jgi:hypothetical protein